MTYDEFCEDVKANIKRYLNDPVVKNIRILSVEKK